MAIEEAVRTGEPWVIERFFSPETVKNLKRWGIVPEGKNPVSRQTTQELLTVDGIITAAEAPSGQPLEDEIDPLELSPDSPLYSLLTFPPVKRLWSIGRLGLSRDAPFINSPSRGQHAFQTGLEALKFSVTQKWSIRDQFLSFIAGATHDPHPALGDAAKMALGIREEDVLSEYFRDEHTALWEQWLGRMNQNLGIRIQLNELRGFIERVVRREESTVPGMIAHGPSKDVLDLDFWTYTVGDVQALVQAVLFPDARYDYGIDPMRETLMPFEERMDDLRYGLIHFDHIEDLGRLRHRIPIYLHEIDIRPHLGAMDEKLVVTDAAVFHRLVQMAAVLHEAHYFNPNNLGPEVMFSREIQRERHRYPTNREFMTLTDGDIVQRFQGTPAGRWLSGAEHHGWSIVGEHAFSPHDALLVETTYPTAKLRLSTRVMDERGRIGPWKELFPEEAVPLVALERQSGKEVTLMREE